MKMRLQNTFYSIEVPRKQLRKKSAKHLFEGVESAFIDDKIRCRFLILIKHALVDTYGWRLDLLQSDPIPAERKFLAAYLTQLLQTCLIMLLERTVHRLEALLGFYVLRRLSSLSLCHLHQYLCFSN